MKRKIFISVLLALMCLCALATVISAEAFYASTAAELKEANQKAIENGEADTIYITADISNAPFVATTSVTYILQANWTGCYTEGGAAKYADYVDIAFYGDGQERTLTFSGNVLMTNQSVKPNNSTISYGGVNGGRLKVDFSSYKNLFMLTSRNYTINLYDVTFTGMRMDKNDWTMLSGKVINIYDGARIENCSNLNGPLIDATTLNIYGGEITGCYTKNNMGRLINVSNFNMLGGSIYGNYQYNYRTDGYTNYFIDASTSANVYGGSIYGNYYTQSGANSGIIGKSGTANTKGSIVESAIGTNYSVSLPLTVEEIDGAFALTSGEVTEVTSKCFKLSAASYSVIFKNASGAAVEAFMVKSDGTLARSLTGAAELTVPSGKWADRKSWCLESAVDLTKQGIYYATVSHKAQNDDFDCTTTLVCDMCAGVIYEAQGSHSLVENLVYPNLFEAGEYKCQCANEGCTIMNRESSDYAPLFKMLGYSVTEWELSTSGAGVVQGFYADKSAISEYERVNDKSLSYGIVAASAIYLDGGNPLTLTNGEVTVVDGARAIMWDATKTDAFQIKITGIDPENEVQANAKLIWCAYVTDGDTLLYLDNGATYENAQAKSYTELVG